MPQLIDEVLGNIEARFLYNLPEAELNQVDRLFFQIEQAWWYYEDFFADNDELSLPHFKLPSFAEKLFNHSLLLAPLRSQCSVLCDQFLAYRSQIPVVGIIMLNADLTQVVLVRGWKGKSWSFPRGKINQGENPVAGAIREAWEETGFDATGYCKEEDMLLCATNAVGEPRKMEKFFIAPGVSEETEFCPQTRKEISEVLFHSLTELPKNTYGVLQFMSQLKRWIRLRRKRLAKEKSVVGNVMTVGQLESGVPVSEKKKKKKRSDSLVSGEEVVVKTKGKNKKNAPCLSGFDARNDDTFADANIDSKKKNKSNSSGWKVADMFLANSKLTGKEYAKFDKNAIASHPHFVNYNAPTTPPSSVMSMTSSTLRTPGGAVSITLPASPNNHLSKSPGKSPSLCPSNVIMKIKRTPTTTPTSGTSAMHSSSGQMSTDAEMVLLTAKVKVAAASSSTTSGVRLGQERDLIPFEFPDDSAVLKSNNVTGDYRKTKVPKKKAQVHKESVKPMTSQVNTVSLPTTVRILASSVDSVEAKASPTLTLAAALAASRRAPTNRPVMPPFFKPLVLDTSMILNAVDSYLSVGPDAGYHTNTNTAKITKVMKRGGAGYVS